MDEVAFSTARRLAAVENPLMSLPRITIQAYDNPVPVRRGLPDIARTEYYRVQPDSTHHGDKVTGVRRLMDLKKIQHHPPCWIHRVTV